MIKTIIHGDKFGYETITLTFTNSDSYFTILHTTHSQNLEKADFQVENAEEFYVFVRVLRKIMKKKQIRYCELFVSAYKPELQTVLYRLGFTPEDISPVEIIIKRPAFSKMQSYLIGIKERFRK